MTKIRFELDDQWKQALSDVEELATLTTEAAKEASSYARETSPVETGSYKAGHDYAPAERATDGEWEATVFNTDRDANIVEFGWGPTPSYRTLTRAVENQGLRFTVR